MEALEAYLKNRQKTPVVLVFVNMSYLPVFDIWYGLYMINPAPDLIVVALDKVSYSNLKQRGIRCFYAGSEEFENFLSLKVFDQRENLILSKLWLLRASVIKRILDSGTDLIHSDCDAFWLKDVYQLFSEMPADMTFSIAFAHPREIVQQWGFIICMGLFMIRSNENTRAFFSDFLDALNSSQSPCDQETFNQLLYKENVRWKRSGLRNHASYLKKYNISIRVLGDHLVSRKRTNRRLYAYHPFLEGDIDKKISDSIVGIRKVLCH